MLWDAFRDLGAGQSSPVFLLIFLLPSFLLNISFYFYLVFRLLFFPFSKTVHLLVPTRPSRTPSVIKKRRKVQGSTEIVVVAGLSVGPSAVHLSSVGVRELGRLFIISMDNKTTRWLLLLLLLLDANPLVSGRSG